MSNEKKNILPDSKTCLTYEIIAAYHENKLSAEDMRKVEEHIIDCRFCSDAFDGYEFTERETFEKDMKEINSKIDSRLKKKSSLKIMFYSSVAAILLIFFSALLNKASRGPEMRVFDEYFSAYPDVTMQTRGAENQSEFKRAMRLYDAGKYAEAIKIFNSISDAEENENVVFYNGVAHLAAGEYEKGLNLLKKLTGDKSNYFYAEANWYAALAEIAKGDFREAEKYLSKIQDNPDYKHKAKRLKETLKLN